jgi:predicted DNA-binding transcriptional regulator AlpA
MPTKRKEGIPSTPKRKQAFDQKFISPRQFAIRWDLSVSAVYHGNADVNLLRRISFGRSIRFLLSEVEAVEAQKIALAN